LYLREVVMLSMRFGNKSGGAFTPAGLFHSHPFGLYDAMILNPRGYWGGFIGYFFLRLHHSVFVNAAVVHLLATAFLTWRICRVQLQAAFCASCGRWVEPANVAVLPAKFLDPLVLAVQSNDVEQALAVTHTAAHLPLGTSCAIARLRHCKTCDSKMVDVILRSYGRRRSGSSIALKAMEVNDELIAALRSEPVLPAMDEDSIESQNKESPE
jgi:hypothetical protein